MSSWMALHGLFGDSSQWSFLENLDAVDKLIAVDLYPLLDKPKDKLMGNLLSLLVDKCQNAGAKNQINLIGHSMGGRIAMELFLKSPESFERLVILASHPGLLDKSQILAREIWEKKWLAHLQQNPSEFISAWNQQSIFENDKPIELPSRPLEQLAGGILNWGLSKQKNLLPLLQNFKQKVYWLIGSEDNKYCEFAKESLQDFKVLKIKGAGHRLLQYPNEISECISRLENE